MQNGTKGKKILLLSIILLIPLFTVGCSENVEVIDMQSDWPGFESLEDLSEKADTIIVGRVEKVYPAEKMNIDISGDSELYMVMTPSDVEILDKIKGSVESDTIQLIQEGGRFEKQHFVIEDMNYLEKGKTYMLFLQNNEEYGFPFTVHNPIYSIIEIESEGNLKFHEKNMLMKEYEQSSDNAIDFIKKNVD